MHLIRRLEQVRLHVVKLLAQLRKLQLDRLHLLLASGIIHQS